MMRRTWTMVAALLAILRADGLQAQTAQRGSGAPRAPSSNSPYARQLEVIALPLVRASGRWKGVSVDGAAGPTLLSIKVQPLTSRIFLAVPGRDTILVDPGYLDQLRLVASAYAAGAGPMRSLALDMELDGVDAVARRRLKAGTIWNRRDGGMGDRLFDGAVAFLLSHEMGHLALRHPHPGTIPDPQAALPAGLKPERRWACDQFIGARHAAQRRMEAEADAFAARLLVAIPGTSKQRPGLQHEFGAFLLMNLELGRATNILAAIREPGWLDRLAVAFDRDVDPALVARLRARQAKNEGFFKTAFPATHPAWSLRLFDTLHRLAQHPESAFHGDNDFQQDRQMFERLVGRTCKV